MLRIISPRLRHLRVTMSLTTPPTHLERTQGISRGDSSPVTVESLTWLSPTVRGFTLRAENENLSFKSGQWVDVHIPSVDTVGGYSITSAPHLLKEKGVFTLAIQQSDHPPTEWMTTQCKTGDKLWVRVGGDFYYDPLSNSRSQQSIDSKPYDIDLGSHDTNSQSHDSHTESHDLILIAGGVGINPLMSMLLYHTKLRESSHAVGRVVLMYSARIVSELLFKNKIDQLCKENQSWLKAYYFVTRQDQFDHTCSSSDISSRRIASSDVSSILTSLGCGSLATGSAKAYVCGPPPMIDSVSQWLIGCGFPQEHILIEKWW